MRTSLKVKVRDRIQHIGIIFISIPVFYALEGILHSLSGSKRPPLTDYAKLTWELMWENIEESTTSSSSASPSSDGPSEWMKL